MSELENEVAAFVETLGENQRKLANAVFRAFTEWRATQPPAAVDAGNARGKVDTGALVATVASIREVAERNTGETRIVRRAQLVGWATAIEAAVANLSPLTPPEAAVLAAARAFQVADKAANDIPRSIDEYTFDDDQLVYDGHKAEEALLAAALRLPVEVNK